MDEKQDLLALSDKISSISLLFQKLREENAEMQDELVKLRKHLKEERWKTLEYKEEFERMKVVNAILGSTENKRLMKTKMNKIIKEVDACIAQLKNQ